MKRKPLTTLKLEWRDQIAKDDRLTPSAFKVGYFMADCVTMDTTKKKYERKGRIVIWPAQSTLADQTSISPDTISKAVKQLEQYGHLKKLRRGSSKTGSNRYEILFKAPAHRKTRDADP